VTGSTVSIVLGLTAALAYGLSDFIAGLLSRRIHYALVALIGNGVACAATIAALVLTAPPDPTTRAIFWGAASGIGSGLGTLVLFRGLARGRMGVVAPLSALGTAVIPILIGVGLGDRPPIPAWAGVLLALPAIWLVSTTGEATAHGKTGAGNEGQAAPRIETGGRAGLASGAVEGLLAGLCFALLLVGLNLAGDGSGLWPVVAGQVCGVVILGIVLVGTLRRLGNIRIGRRDAGVAAAVGVLGAVASTSYFLSTQAGLLSIVAVLTALYPAATVLLARVVIHERVAPRQALGLALAGIAVMLIVLG
jgi:uncharacterized membrane protein